MNVIYYLIHPSDIDMDKERFNRRFRFYFFGKLFGEKNIPLLKLSFDLSTILGNDVEDREYHRNDSLKPRQYLIEPLSPFYYFYYTLL